MRRSARALVAACALAAASAAAQTAKESAAPAQERSAGERRPLNLKLDNPSSWASTAPEAEKQGQGLPTLGADARPIPADAPRTGSRTSPYPSEPSPGR